MPYGAHPLRKVHLTDPPHSMFLGLPVGGIGAADKISAVHYMPLFPFLEHTKSLPGQAQNFYIHNPVLIRKNV